jgi:hypothetical protein
MKRREFITLLGGAAVGWPLAASAQTQPKIPRVGLIFANTPATITYNIEAFRQGLRELGYVEGQTIVLEVRGAEGRVERMPGLVAERHAGAKRRSFDRIDPGIAGWSTSDHHSTVGLAWLFVGITSHLSGIAEIMRRG